MFQKLVKEAKNNKEYYQNKNKKITEHYGVLIKRKMNTLSFKINFLTITFKKEL